MVGSLLGGIGLFLLGMELLTDGLQTAAGDSIRTALRRYTRSRASGVLVGAAATALAQSSSATTLAVIGFVGAGLLPFEQVLGVVYGANVGTTVTAWIVATVGLKVNMSWFALPLVGAGAVIKLFTRGKRSALGAALAGFGLIFVGIDVLQTGMMGLADKFDPREFALSGFAGRVALLALGVLMTVVMQSSSAAVATTLTAVHSGALTIEQAAAVVIGQNVGTTVTAMIAAAGGSSPARRVAAAHVIFNVGTGALALVLLPAFVDLVERWIGRGDPSVALSGFHTAFNVLGVLLFLPLTGRLAAALEKRFPERGSALTARLSRAGATVPAVAVEAARLTANDIGRAATELAAKALRDSDAAEEGEPDRAEIAAALVAAREHLKAVRTDPAAPAVYRQHIAVLHAIDHLHRLTEALGEHRNARAAKRDATIHAAAEKVAAALDDAARWLAVDDESPPPPLDATSRAVAEQRRGERAAMLERTAAGELSPADAEVLLEAMRWVDRIGYHAWRAVHHLDAADRDLPLAPPPAPEREGRRADESYDASV